MDEQDNPMQCLSWWQKWEIHNTIISYFAYDIHFGLQTKILAADEFDKLRSYVESLIPSLSKEGKDCIEIIFNNLRDQEVIMDWYIHGQLSFRLSEKYIEILEKVNKAFE